MFEGTPNQEENKSENQVELLDTGITMPASEYQRYRNILADFMDSKAVPDINELTDEERVKLGEVAMQMASGLKKFADVIEMSRRRG